MKVSVEQGKPQMQSVPPLWSGWALFGAQGSDAALKQKTTVGDIIIQSIQ